MEYRINAIAALSWLATSGRAEWPGSGGIAAVDQAGEITEAEWEALPWGGEFWRDVPKPPWSEMVVGHRAYRLQRWAVDETPALLNAAIDAGAETAALQPIPSPHGEGEYHTGGGISHMDALAYLHRLAGEPGRTLPPAVLRRTGLAGYDALLTPAEYGAFLSRLAEIANRAESAKNIVAHRILHLRAVARGDLPPLDDNGDPVTGGEAEVLEWREQALEALLLVEKFGAGDFYTEAFAELDAGGLPDDPERVRQIYLADLEAVAAERSAWMLDALGEQGAPLAPGCDEQAESLRRVTSAKQRASNDLRRASGLEAMLAARDAGVDTIRAVKVRHSPAWSNDRGAALVFQADGSLLVPIDHQAGEQHVVTVRAVNPSGLALDLGTVSIDIPAESRVAGWTVALSETDGHPEAEIRWGGVGTPLPETRFVLIARNACGPSDFRLTVRNTAA